MFPSNSLLLIDTITICVLLFLMFRGTTLSEHIDLYYRPLFVCKLLTGVICLRNVVSKLLQKKLEPMAAVLKFLGRSLIPIVCSVAFFHVLAVIYGVPLLSNISQTFHFAVLLTSTTTVTCCCVLGPSLDIWAKAFSSNNSEQYDPTVRTVVILSILGAWLGAFPIPLDWDTQWQVWPISCAVGNVVGYIVGLILAHVQTMYNSTLATNKLVLHQEKIHQYKS